MISWVKGKLSILIALLGLAGAALLFYYKEVAARARLAVANRNLEASRARELQVRAAAERLRAEQERSKKRNEDNLDNLNNPDD